MGNTMHINKEILNQKIVKLSSKKFELFGYSYDKCDKNSSGRSPDKLKEIELLYDRLKVEIEVLYDQTISYMQSLAEQVDELDNTIADSMNVGE